MVLLCLCLTAGAQEGWTLSQCIDYALQHNLSVKQTELNVSQRQVELNTARNSMLPGVSASGSQNFSFGRGLTADNTYANTNTTNTSLSLGASMMLFNGMKTSNNIAMSRLNLEAATADLEKARDDIRVAVAQAYVQILYDMEICDVAAEQVGIDSLQLFRLEEMASNGKCSNAEVAAQRASLAQSRLTAVQADNNLALALLELTQLLELPTPEGFTIVRPDDDCMQAALLRNPDDIYREAIGIKPSVKAEETRLEVADRNIALAKGDYLPTLSLSGGLGTNYYTSSGYNYSKFFEQLGNNFSQYVGLSLNIPIFSRMSVRNNVRSAQLSYDNQKLQLDNVKKGLYKEIQQAYYNALAAQGKYESSSVAAESAREAFDLMQAKYENGKANITEFNESKNQYMKAESDLTQARYEYLYLGKILDFYRGVELR